jgi:hypothetical protein
MAIISTRRGPPGNQAEGKQGERRNEMNKQDLSKEISSVEAEEIAVETNSGTYGAAEACRKIGSGSSEFADYTIYERVGDGSRRTVGCDPTSAPGRARRINADQLAARRKYLSELRRQIG